ncbi:PAS domain S-box protein [Bradyrhizobium sp. vgs-9]|uniref:PAS domain-containing sensor histidine kinase n=1 Tax=Bradyrhizobium TaxID=374 RepID=UPI001BA7871F|nr:PAS domain S-box protein [Bradyrhizobium japonicum]MBR0766359.1 PAS domain S-box protein [Bradyrhizobium japonicum]
MSGFAKAKCALGRLPLREDGLRLVLETSLDAVIVMKLNSVVVEWNSRATEIFGWSREEAVGRRVVDFIIPERFREAHINGIQRYLESVKNETQVRSIELSGLRGNGEEFPLELSITPVQDRHDLLFVVCLRDISASKRAEERAHLAEEELRAIVDTIPAMAVRHRADGTIDFVNETWRGYTGLSLESWNGRGNIAIHPDDLSRVEEAWLAALKNNDPFETEQRLRRADGEYRWHSIRRVPLRDDNGEVVAWYGAGYDIHDRKLVETALRKSEAQLADAKRELQAVVDTIPALIGSCWPNGERDFANEAWQRYTGIFQEKARGMNTSGFLRPDNEAVGDSIWRACLETGAPDVREERLRRVDGEYRWHWVSRVPLRNERGDVIKWHAVGYDIEDRKQAEQALRESRTQLAKAERELRLTLDSIPTLAWRSRTDGFVEYLNKRWLDYTGFSQEQALGWDWQAAIHPSDRPALRDAWLKMLATETPSEVEARMRRFDGAYRWFLFRTEALRDESGAIVAWYGTNTDVQARKQAESALQRSSAYLAETQRLSLTGSFAWEVVGGHPFWSDETYKILGFDRGTKPSFDALIARVHPDDRALARRQIESIAQGANNLDSELQLLMPDGKTKYLRIIAHRVRFESGNDEIVGALIDKTEVRTSQEALDSAQAALAHASRVAILGEISATIAHEIKQPLAAIITNGETGLRSLARPEPVVEKAEKLTRRMVADARRAVDIVDGIRAMGTRQASKHAMLSLNDIVEDSMVFLRHELQAKSTSVSLDLALAPPRVLGDRTQLQQVVLNLAINAVQAMAQSGVERRCILIRTVQLDHETVCCIVEDSGPGIDPTRIPRLFDTFFTTKDTGMGLGLSISRSIIEAHGGCIRAENGSGLGGARFTFDLPVANAFDVTSCGTSHPG